MAHDVFVSYSSKDRGIADEVVGGLEERGIRCWMAPRDILPATTWAESIMDALRSSRLMIIVITAHSNESRHVVREVERAVQHGARIIPFRVEDVEPSPALEYFLGTQHWMDAATPPLSQHVERLAHVCAVLLGRESASSAATAAWGKAPEVPAPPAVPPAATPPAAAPPAAAHLAAAAAAASRPLSGPPAPGTFSQAPRPSPPVHAGPPAAGPVPAPAPGAERAAEPTPASGWSPAPAAPRPGSAADAPAVGAYTPVPPRRSDARLLFAVLGVVAAAALAVGYAASRQDGAAGPAAGPGVEAPGTAAGAGAVPAGTVPAAPGDPAAADGTTGHMQERPGAVGSGDGPVAGPGSGGAIVSGDAETYAWMEEAIVRGEVVAPEDMESLEGNTLRMLRNVVYARHGFRFAEPELHAYFSGKPWYSPDPSFSEARLSSNDRANLQALQQAEH